ncbi:MAG TPA: hypothetical protein VHL78_08160, partial [Actinomycetota bacterium]|nr:hypothetical protein [Actinomycetota bacterium]
MAVGRRGAAAAAIAAVLAAGCGQHDLTGIRAPAAPAAARPAPAPAGDAARPDPDRPAEDGGERRRAAPGEDGPVAPRAPEPPVPGAPLDDAARAVPRLPGDPRRVAVVVGIDDYPGDGDDLRAAAAA